jgi:hypothetical protein
LYCDDPLLPIDANFTVFQTNTGTLLEPNTRKQLPLGAKYAENPQFGNHKHCSIKTLRIWEENPAVWYSNNVHQPVIIPNALSQSIK